MRQKAEEIDQEKENAIRTLIDEMVKDEVKKKTDFYNEKKQEARDAGLDADEIVPNVDFDDEYERKLKLDLENLAEELRKLGDEVRKTWPPKEMSQEAKDKLNEEMMERMKALNALRPRGLENNQADSKTLDVSDFENDIGNYC